MFTPIFLGLLAAVWRYIDGSDARPKGSNVMAAAILSAAYLAALPSITLASALQNWSLLVPTLVTGWLLVRGMPGFEYWLPNTAASGKRRAGMLLGFAVPTAAAASIYMLIQGISPGAIFHALSGAMVAATYVALSRLTPKYPYLFRSFTAEQWGRLSYGFLIASLAAL